jgi:hypothetical protein
MDCANHIVTWAEALRDIGFFAACAISVWALCK